MGLFANRAATRMGARQQYRTMARMQRRRSSLQQRMGTHQDFQPNESDDQELQSEKQSKYTEELKELAQLKNEGILTEDEYTAKKKKLLGI